MLRIAILLTFCVASCFGQDELVPLELWLIDEELSEDSVDKGLLLAAKDAGYEIRISEFSEAGFREAMDTAKKRGSGYPDIVAGFLLPSELSDDYVRCLGFLTGIRSHQSAARTFLFRHSKNHEKAMDLAMLKFGESADLPTQWSYTNRRFKESGFANDSRGRLELRKRVRNAFDAFLRQDMKSLAKLLHKDALSLQRKQPVRRQATRAREVGSIRISYLGGNQSLAFAYGLVGMTFRNKESQQVEIVGSIPVISVWRKSGAEWRLMIVTDDPISVLQLPAIADGCKRLSKEPTPLPDKPVLSSPEDGKAAEPKEEQRFGDYQWELNGEPLLEIAEFDYGSGTRFVINPGGKLSAGELWTVRDKWFWRVWAVGADGRAVVSRARTFRE